MITLATVVGFAASARANVDHGFVLLTSGGGETSFKLEATGTISSISISVTYDNLGTGTWSGDLFLGIVAPNGATVE